MTESISIGALKKGFEKYIRKKNFKLAKNTSVFCSQEFDYYGIMENVFFDGILPHEFWKFHGFIYRVRNGISKLNRLSLFAISVCEMFSVTGRVICLVSYLESGGGSVRVQQWSVLSEEVTGSMLYVHFADFKDHPCYFVVETKQLFTKSQSSKQLLRISQAAGPVVICPALNNKTVNARIFDEANGKEDISLIPKLKIKNS